MPSSPNRAYPVPAVGLTVFPNHHLIYKCSSFVPVVRSGVPKLSPGYTTEMAKIFQIFFFGDNINPDAKKQTIAVM